MRVNWSHALHMIEKHMIAKETVCCPLETTSKRGSVRHGIYLICQAFLHGLGTCARCLYAIPSLWLASSTG